MFALANEFRLTERSQRELPVLTSPLVNGREHARCFERKAIGVLEGSFNLDGALEIEVTELGSDSTINKIARFV